jgi:hypothetical protein
MPTYTFRNKDTGEVFEQFMSISELDVYKESHPELVQQPSAPFIGDAVRLGLKKADPAFRDYLKSMNKANSKGVSKSTINYD